MHAADSSKPGRTAIRAAVASRVAARHSGAHALPEGGLTTASWPGSAAPTAVEVSAFAARRRPDGVVRDRLIGVVVAAAIHLAVLFGFNGRPEEVSVAKAAPEEMIVQLEMPELEPPETIEVVEANDAPPAPQIAPPMLMDMPTTVAVSSFVQPLRPTLDPGLMSVGAITIPSAVASFGGQASVRLFDLKELDRVPRRVRTVVPTYPHELRRAGITGVVVLLVVIDVSGHVEVERVLSTTNREFEAAAVKAAEQCMFEPPLRGGQRVNARYTWEIPFELRQ